MLLFKYCFFQLFTLCVVSSCLAANTCQGKFVNPITDVCWSCILPIQLGPVKIGGASGLKGRDTKNPSCPICFCKKGAVPLAPGIPLAFWEPVRMIEVTRTPLCMVNLGGISFGSKSPAKLGGYHKNHAKRRHKSFYHVHYYMYPLIAILELVADLGCMDKGSIDVLYMSEFDPMWQDEKLQNLMYPDSILYGHPLMQATCATDCVASSFTSSIDSMHWCAGCHGNMFPIAGTNADHVGGVRTSLLLSMRLLNKMHRAGLAHETSTDSCAAGGKLCASSLSFNLKKSQYKLQMTYPLIKNDETACVPLGITDLKYSANREYPHTGQDWGYILWRKRNCCFF